VHPGAGLLVLQPWSLAKKLYMNFTSSAIKIKGTILMKLYLHPDGQALATFQETKWQVQPTTGQTNLA
jgi:hypothetical protein